jgi:diguanylate cyclase (GGDEF)-like protein
MAPHLSYWWSRCFTSKKKLFIFSFFPLTISAGFAVRKSMAYTIEEVIKQADKALYKVKANGRNRVEVYNE